MEQALAIWLSLWTAQVVFRLSISDGHKSPADLSYNPKSKNPAKASLYVNDATVPLPTHLNNLAILDQNRHGALPGGHFTHPRSSLGIGFNVVFHKL
jgi:hypothetical protein